MVRSRQPEGLQRPNPSALSDLSQDGVLPLADVYKGSDFPFQKSAVSISAFYQFRFKLDFNAISVSEII